MSESVRKLILSWQTVDAVCSPILQSRLYPIAVRSETVSTSRVQGALGDGDEKRSESLNMEGQSPFSSERLTSQGKGVKEKFESESQKTGIEDGKWEQQSGDNSCIIDTGVNRSGSSLCWRPWVSNNAYV